MSEISDITLNAGIGNLPSPIVLSPHTCMALRRICCIDLVSSLSYTRTITIGAGSRSYSSFLIIRSDSVNHSLSPSDSSLDAVTSPSILYLRIPARQSTSSVSISSVYVPSSLSPRKVPHISFKTAFMPGLRLHHKFFLGFPGSEAKKQHASNISTKSLTSSPVIEY